MIVVNKNRKDSQGATWGSIGMPLHYCSRAHTPLLALLSLHWRAALLQYSFHDLLPSYRVLPKQLIRWIPTIKRALSKRPTPTNAYCVARAHTAWFALMVTLQRRLNRRITLEHSCYLYVFFYKIRRNAASLDNAHRFPVYSGGGVSRYQYISSQDLRSSTT
jgi:hypothetical protein